MEAAVGYSEAVQALLDSGRDYKLPHGGEGVLGLAYLYAGQPKWAAEWCRAQLERGRDTHTLTRAFLVMSLTAAGSVDEATAAANGLIEAADATRNPYVLSNALFAYGYAFRETDPDRALHAFRRGMAIAQDSGNRANESGLAVALASLETVHGDPLAALDYVAVAIRNFHDSGGAIQMALTILSAVFDQLRRYEPAATIAGFAISPVTITVLPELSATVAHLRDVLGDPTYESLAGKGETMTTAEMATYAYVQMDQARAELNAVSE